MSIDLVLYIVIAAALIFWLRNTLGTRHGDERDRPNPLEGLSQGNKVVDITGQVRMVDDPVASVLKGLPIEGDGVTQEILDLLRFDPTFNFRQFMEGARDAFPLIVEAFAKADLVTLRNLLSASVYNAFEQAIEDRGVRGETVSTEVHAVKSVKILGIKRIERMVFIKLRFEAEETCVIRDREGTVLSGNPDRITTMNDVWTFGRDSKSKDPTWHLFETNDDVIEEIKTPIPNAKETGV